MKIRSCIGSLVLGAALVAPVAVFTAGPAPAMAQDRDHDRDHKRYYDRDRKDWHDWDDREDRAYRHWVTEERHEKYRDFGRLDRERQREYWRWRHDHPDWEHERH